MGDAPRLTDDGLEIVRVRAELGQRNIHPKDIASIARELTERRAQSEGAQAKVVEALKRARTYVELTYDETDRHEAAEAKLDLALVDAAIDLVSPPRQTEEKTHE